MNFNLEKFKARKKLAIQNATREFDKYIYMLNADICMFAWSGLPAEIDPVYLEKWACECGSVGFGQTGGRFIIVPEPARGGTLDIYGYGDTLQGVANNGDELTGTVGKNVAVLYNNLCRLPEFDSFLDAEQLAEIEKSSGVNVKLSRFAPIFPVTDDNQARQFAEIFKKLAEGEPQVTTSTNIITMLDGASTIYHVDITEPEKIQYLQYLSQFYDVVLKKHFNRRGLPVRTSSKAAQQSPDEVHGMDALSWVYPLNKLQARKTFCEEVNRIFGLSVSVDFSDVWKSEYKKFMTADQSEEGGNDDRGEQDENF